ncbi:ABC transporter ATP-binding protein [Roseibium sp.]|uniref:ABC transporter ATP-binding protein n=1 Tax=Roseibium sp. TaxID=1936156 RepID=UPI003A97EBE9
MTSRQSVAVAGEEIRLENVVKAYGDSRAVDDISVTLPAGAFTVLLGPSGCGKSTTLRMIAGLEEVTSGAITIGGKDITGLNAARRNISMVFQSYALFPHLSVAENITFGLKVRRVAKAEREDRLKTVADLLGLSLLLDRKPSQLSGGQQQRVALGRAIIAEKPVCLMDEPLSNLDAKLRHEMRVEIRGLQQQLGFTMVYVTHDQVEAITMADQVVLLNGGKIEQVANPRALYEKPATAFAARFIGSPPMNIIPSTSLPLLGENTPDVLFGLRPEALELRSEGPVRGRARTIEYLGADTLVACDVGGTDVLARLPSGRSVAAGDALSFGFAPDTLHIFDQTSGKRRDDLITQIGLQVQSS